MKGLEFIRYIFLSLFAHFIMLPPPPVRNYEFILPWISHYVYSLMLRFSLNNTYILVKNFLFYSISLSYKLISELPLLHICLFVICIHLISCLVNSLQNSQILTSLYSCIYNPLSTKLTHWFICRTFLAPTLATFRYISTHNIAILLFYSSSHVYINPYNTHHY